MTRRVASAGANRTTRRAATPARSHAQTRALADLEHWRSTAIPDATTPLEAEDLVRLLRDCITTLQLDTTIVADLSVNTVHYYRRKDIIDPPIGKTVSARYGVHHLWQVAGARLAGFLGLVTLAEARDAIRGATETTSMGFLAARVADARAQEAVRDAQPAYPVIREMRPLPRVASPSGAMGDRTSATVVALPGDAWCVIPATHPALHTTGAADALVRALAVALGTVSYS